MYANFSSPQVSDSFLPLTYNTNTLEINFCQESGIIKLFWKSKLTRQDLEEGYMMVFEYIKAYKPKKYLLDLHLRDRIPEENRVWFFETIIPKMLQLTETTTFLAAIVPVDYYASLTDEFNSPLLPLEDQLLVIDHFLLPEMGIDWLKSVG